MSVARLDTFAYDTSELRAQQSVFGTPVTEPSPVVAGVDNRRVAFHPLTAAPAELPDAGTGRVVWLLGEGADPGAAALAWLLSSQRGGKGLLADVGLPRDASPTMAAPARIGETRVWRCHAPRPTARLRDWVLFFNRCRTTYDQTVLTPRLPDGTTPERLFALADGVIVLALADSASLGHARGLLQRLHRAGVRGCECLLLEAA